MSREDAWWPPHDPEEWECTSGLDCDEGWFITPPEAPGQAATARRCPCMVANIRERKRRRRQEAAETDWIGGGQW